MQTIQPIRIDQTNARTKRLLESVTTEFGRVSNMMKSMAQSTAALDAYLLVQGALSEGKLDAKFRERIALAVAQANRCNYSLAEHATLAVRLGLDGDEILASRAARSDDPKVDAGLKFACGLVVGFPQKSAGDLPALRQVGYSDEEIVEIIANVAFNVYANNFNIVAGTEVDFPEGGVDVAAA